MGYLSCPAYAGVWVAGGGAPELRLLQPGPGLAPGSPGRDDATGGRLIQATARSGLSLCVF